MKTALIVVDVQRDFLPGGALAVPGGDEILPEIKLLAMYVDARVTDGRDPPLVWASRDYHPSVHVSFSPEPEFRDGSWPVHCVAGAPGSYMDPVARRACGGRIGRTITKGTDPEWEAYSAFDGVDGFGRTLASELKRLSVEELIVCGLALDYCVKATAIDAAALGFSVRVPLGATRATSEEGKRRAVKELVGSGVVVEPFESVRDLASEATIALTKEDSP